MSTGQANTNISLTPSSKVVSIFAGDYAAADEGSFFTTFLAATANTAVAVTTQALATTSPVFVLFNGNAPGGNNIYMRYLKFRITVAQTALTTVEQVGVINATSGAQTTAGTAMAAPVNVNGSSNTLSKALTWGGVNVMATPGTNARIVHSGPVVGIIPIVLDSWHFYYGDPVGYGANQEAATTTKIVTLPLPPVIVAPQQWYSFGVWGASMAATAATYKMDVGFIERPSGQ
jgi:hypothetical protein